MRSLYYRLVRWNIWLFARSFYVFVHYFRRVLKNVDNEQVRKLTNIKGDSRPSFWRTRGKRKICLHDGQKTRLRLFTIDNSFLKTPLKSELNISFWVAPAGNNGTSEKVALFLSIECSKRNSCSIFQSHRSFHSHAGLRGTFSVTGTDVYKRWWRSALRLTSWIGWLPTFVLPLEDATGPKRGLLSFIRGGSKISPNSLPINTPILTKKVPLSYTFYTIN